MCKGCLHGPGVAHNRLLGRFKESGRVYRIYPGSVDEIGHVHLDSGKAYALRLDNNEYLCRVGFGDAKVSRDVAAGPDEYLGRMHEKGRMDCQVAGRADEYIVAGSPTTLLGRRLGLLSFCGSRQPLPSTNSRELRREMHGREKSWMQ